ncbi:MAG: hypothetical protein IPG89_10545 [Bacteroidetes bacterium]|nr:hypothetical protein [Bacteroidota bacterium]
MVLKSKNNVFQQEAEWYRALSYAKLGETQQAISLLIKINEKKVFMLMMQLLGWGDEEVSC